LDWGPDYCYGWGPGWVAPTPWCWWQPFGFWGGCNFYPFGLSFAFGDFDDFHNFHHGGFFGHDGHFHQGENSHHAGSWGHGHDASLWHSGPQGRNSFFGTPARPSASVAQWARTGSPAQSRSTLTPAHSIIMIGNQVVSGSDMRPSIGSSSSSRADLTTPGARAGQNHSESRSTAPRSPASSVGALGSYRPSPAPHITTFGAPPHHVPAYSWAPRYADPRVNSFRGYGGGRSSVPMSLSPGSFSGRAYAGGFHGGSSHSRSSYSGGFHGGGLSGGGGFHGGGHR